MTKEINRNFISFSKQHRNNLAETMQRGITLHQKGQLEEASHIYQQVISHNPQHFDALKMLGVLAYQRGENQLAIELISQSITINPNYADAHYNLGVALQERGELEQAIQSYRRALAINPDVVDPHINMGNVLKEQGKLEQAISCYQQAIQVNPNHADAYNNLGNIYQGLNKTQQAINCYQQSTQVNPNHADAYNNLGNVYQGLNKTQQAINCYQQVINLCDQMLTSKPYDQKIYNRRQSTLHLLNGLKGVTTKKAPKEYVQNLFNSYVMKFDHHLTVVLDYKVPEILRKLLQTKLGSNFIFDKVIDLGCGTGLSGQAFRPICRQLVGIDLSPKMIKKAQEKGVYDKIENVDINEYLENRTEKYNMFIATDLLIYVGELEKLFSNISKVAESKAIFLFSTESVQHTDYVLTNQGRFAHSENYIHRLAKLNKFNVISKENTTIRKGVDGQLFILQLQQ